MNLAKPFEMNSEDNEELFKVENISPPNKQTKIHSLQLEEWLVAHLKAKKTG